MSTDTVRSAGVGPAITRYRHMKAADREPRHQHVEEGHSKILRMYFSKCPDRLLRLRLRVHLRHRDPVDVERVIHQVHREASPASA